MNLRDICRNPEWKPVSTASLKRMNFLPNRVLQNMTALEVAVVLRRSRRGGFGISKPVVDYYDERLRSGKVRQVWVLFVEQDSTVIDWCPMSEVIREVADQEPTIGANPEWPEHYWL